MVEAEAATPAYEAAAASTRLQAGVRRTLVLALVDKEADAASRAAYFARAASGLVEMAECIREGSAAQARAALDYYRVAVDHMGGAQRGGGGGGHGAG